MNGFIKRFTSKLGSAVLDLKCCHNLQAIENDETTVFLMLPGDLAIAITTPRNACEDDYGICYVNDFDVESPELPVDELIDWTEDWLNCSKRIRTSLNAYSLNCAMSPTAYQRVKKVFLAAQNSVDIPAGFSFGAFRENKEDEKLISSIKYNCAAEGKTIQIASSALSAEFPVGEHRDEWNFEPNYQPPSSSFVNTHRKGTVIDMEWDMYSDSFEGPTPAKRDEQAARWLNGLIRKMIDSMLAAPPNHVYEYFLADGISSLSLDNLTTMSNSGIMRLVRKGIVDAEEFLKHNPNLYMLQALLDEGYVTGEQVIVHIPNKTAWLLRNGYITEEKALELNPEYRVAQESKQTPAEPVATEPVATEEPAPVDTNSSRKELEAPVDVDSSVKQEEQTEATENTEELNSAVIPEEAADVSESIQDTNQTGRAWLVRGTMDGTGLNDVIINLIVPGKSKVEALNNYTKIFKDNSHIVSWEEEIDDIQSYKKNNPDKDYAIIKKDVL